MTNVVTALTAKRQLGQIIRRATQNNERFVIDRRGQPSVVIMSIKDYVERPDEFADGFGHQVVVSALLKPLGSLRR